MQTTIAVTAIAALAALSMATPVLASGPVNLLPNPSFERGGDTPKDWIRWAFKGSTLRRDDTVARTGKASGLIEIAPEGAGEYPSYKYELRNVAAGEAYEGTVYCRTRGMTDLGGYTVIEYYTGDRRISFDQSDFTGPGDHDWMPLRVQGVVPPGVDSIRFAVVAHGVGKVWFDDAALVRVMEAPKALEGDRVAVRVRPEQTVNARFLGFGSQGDYFLTRACNTSRGVSDDDRRLVQQRVREMRPAIIRTFFDYKWWEPEKGRRTPDSEAMRDYVAWVRFLKSIGTSVLLCPWGDSFAYPAWMKCDGGRLPAPEEREAMIQSLVELVAYLRRDEGLDNVRYLCLMNEPDSDFLRSVAIDDYVALCRTLDDSLRQRGLRGEIAFLGADDCKGLTLGASEWFRQVLERAGGFCDGMSSHTYQHQYVPALGPWVAERRKLVGHRPLPVMITEFGYGGSTFDNPENASYEYGLFLGDFAIAALQSGASAALQWCMMDTHYDDRFAQHWGLWEYKDKGWKPRPGYHSWSLVTRYTRPGSRVVGVECEPDVAQVQAAALVSPEGKLTIMLVNRLARPIQVSLDAGFSHPATLRAYCYDRRSASSAGDGMIPSSGVVRARPGTPVTVELPAEAFVVLSDVRE